ncbi:hypothetical protein BDV96DRAFT_637838 [Lophiotrema nucula]|uniref:Mid2 domain-containing protein n=1 Tax=Lophiotrema nucula TaxID=690887 RepID=A0A6A5YIP4_9PLEO|nr:hypothetical protein BDV96DRAFT_637838 [Lophiotrema nucula]
MPIVNQTSTFSPIGLEPGAVGPTPVISLSYDDAGYSHGTVFTTFHTEALSLLDTISLSNVPPLTTQFLAPTSCDRWLMARDSSLGGIAESLHSPLWIPVIWSTQPAKGASEFDASYTSCQPYDAAPTYSPGVCPQGQTVAEITEHQISASGSTSTWWQASCCRSGMTFGTEWNNACISHVSTKMSAFAPVTTDSTDFSTYELTTTDSNGESTTITNMQTITTGVAIAHPVIVAWESHDLSVFPVDYASSLARRIDVTLSLTSMSLPPTTDMASTSQFPTQTRVPDSDGHLTTGAKVGIGIGVILGAALFGVGIVLWYMRKMHKTQVVVEAADGTAEMEDQDQDLAGRKWFFKGRWRSEVEGTEESRELDSKVVNVLPGPPQELEGDRPMEEVRHS